MPEKLHLNGGVTQGITILASLFQVLSDLLKCDHTVSVCQFQSVFYVNNFASFANLLKIFSIYFWNIFKYFEYLSKHIIVAPFEVVANFKIILLSRYLFLDFTVGVVDDGKEHIEKNKENKEDIGQKEYGSKNPIGLLDLVKVEVSKDGSEESEDSVGEAAKVFNLWNYL